MSFNNEFNLLTFIMITDIVGFIHTSYFVFLVTKIFYAISTFHLPVFFRFDSLTFLFYVLVLKIEIVFLTF